MKTLLLVLTAAILGVSVIQVKAQSDANLPVPSVGVKADVPGAVGMPDPGRDYKVVFDIVAGAPEVGDVNAGLTGVGQFLNTLDQQGVPAEHRNIAIVLHRDATEVILNNDAFKSRNNGHDNPNISLLKELRSAGVDIRQCGQAIVNMGIDPAAILPEVQLDYWALTTLLEFQLEGYVKVGG
jgi:intracellular sulfur oxidation DsrE/DsrF family protein